MGKCPFCGRENPAEVELCKGCGAKLPDSGAQPAAEPPTSDRNVEQPSPEEGDFEGRLLAELQAGRKIAAVKLYREQTGVGLKEAKDAVEALGEKHGIVATRGGCAGVLVLLLLVCAAAATAL